MRLHLGFQRETATVSGTKETSLRSITGLANSDPKFGWPGDLANASEAPVTSLSQYVERLVKLGYLERDSLPKLFAGPGVTPYKGTGPFTDENSVFKMGTLACSWQQRT